MNKFRFFAVATILAAVFIAPAAFAQTPVNITITSGNGQVTCPFCTQAGFGLQNFEPLYVKVTDANGNPVQSAAVNWTVAQGQGNFPNGTQTQQTTTDGNGNTYINYLLQSSLTGSSINPYAASTITASISNNATANFYLTQALVPTVSSNNNAAVFVAIENLTPVSYPSCSTCINPGDTLTGTAGSTSAVQFEVSAYVPGNGTPIPNISLRLVSNQTSPSVSCASGAGADPGSVLTNANGLAVCTVVIGPGTGYGSFYFLVGGVVSSVETGGPLGFFQSGNFNLQVTPGIAGTIAASTGLNQTANPGQPVPVPLVATVGDANGNPLAGQSVVWTVSPAGAATLSNTSTTSNASGQVQTNVTLAASAAGSIQVKVALANNANISTTFNVTASVQVSALTVVSGNPQSAIVNNPFTSPLVVQLSTSNGVVANIPVFFSISNGLATLSSSSSSTNSAGQAEVTVTAGSTPGPVTVVASAGGVSATFNLTVIAQGPTLTANNFYNGADLQLGSISPCSLATIIAPGVAPAIQGQVAYGTIGALPISLAGDTVTFNGTQAPISSVANMNGNQSVTFQVPCSVVPGNAVPVTVNVSGASATVNVPVLPSSPGLFTTRVSSTSTIPVLERPDGSFVSPTNPARRGETLIAYVTGLGPTSPAVATNALPVPGSTAMVLGTVIAGVSGGGATLYTANLTPDSVGVYAVAFQVPSTVPSGTTVSFSIGLIPQGSSSVNYSSTAYFPVQ